MNYTEEQVNVMNIGRAIEGARDALLAKQIKEKNDSAYWQFPLEADCTIPAEYILLYHFLGDAIPNSTLSEKLINYILEKQNMDGGWPLYDGGPSDLSTTVKCYFALKAEGADIRNQRMSIARRFVIENGGAEQSNVFTRILLALFEQVPWETIPYQPMEMILLPKWSPFHIDKVAYWSRCVMLPLAVLVSNKAKAKNRNKIQVGELFRHNPWTYNDYFNNVHGLRPKVILKVEKLCRRLFGHKNHEEANMEISEWLKRRSNGADGLGGIFPAMAGLLMALPYLDIKNGSKLEIEKYTKLAIEKLVVNVDEKSAYIQACVSPVWDTAIAILALKETQDNYYDVNTNLAIHQAAQWLISKQISIKGDWIKSANIDLNLPYNGWAFQHRNDYYPDVDDTAMVLLAIDDQIGARQSIYCGKTWLTTMQSKNGGYGAFDANNDHHWINDIPFADHKCMLDPPTADVSGRVLAAIGGEKNRRHFSKPKLIQFLLKEQQGGFWWGRWGTNYLWGTWSAVMGLKDFTGIPDVCKALEVTGFRLAQIANNDGGYGESNESYEDGRMVGAPSNAFHTALALLIMCDLYTWGVDRRQEFYIAAQNAAEWLLDNQQKGGGWKTEGHNAPGFPKVFMLKYHGYSQYFPLWALAKYQKTFG